ncbi:MAG TPA: enoyl-CoA hydratase-related protein [Candidatus Dormibacteraeota bacterium]|nr:enoyl-CoA hydratase-related protein [Candidatus Dormibacteraeota bacterium]
MAVELEQHVKLETEGAVAWIRLNRPEKLNAIGAVMRKQLSDAVKQAERDDAVRVLVLTGSGRAFSAGGDIAEMDQGMGTRSPDELGRVLRDEYGAMFIRLRTMSKPVIAALNGPAFGIGASLAIACDMRIGTPESSLTEAFINIGLVMEGGASFLLPRLAGLGVAYEMLFSGRPLSAADAHRLGLINRIVPGERLEDEVRELAQQIASQPRQALAGIKKAVNRALTSTYEEAVEFESYLQEAQAANGEFTEGVRKFQAGRAKK